MMKKIALAVAALSLSATAAATPFVWGNVYTDLLVNENASKKESQIFGLEGGVSTPTTDIYGFFEHNADLDNQFGKVTAHRKVVDNFTVYGHATAFYEGAFSEARYVLGVGHDFSGENYSIKPYVGAVRISNWKTEDNVAFGYSGYYVTNQGVTLSSWADARIEESKVKAQGSIGAQMDVTMIPNVYVGAFYNMSYGEQGVKHFADSVQLRVGYKF